MNPEHTPSSKNNDLAGIDSFRFRFRMVMDKVMQRVVSFAGVSIILAVVSIFAFLLYVVYPIFLPAKVELQGDVELAGSQFSETEDIMYMAVDERRRVLMRVTNSGEFVFFGPLSRVDEERNFLFTAKDSEKTSEELILEKGRTIVSFAVGETQLEGDEVAEHGLVGFGLDNGHVMLARYSFVFEYPDVIPQVDYPFGENSFIVDVQSEAITHLAIMDGEESASLAATTEDKRLFYVALVKEQDGLDEDDFSVERIDYELPYPATAVTKLIIDKDQRELYIVSEGGILSYYNISEKEEAPKLIQHFSIVSAGTDITAIESLNGGESLLVGASDGSLAQWSLLSEDVTEDATEASGGIETYSVTRKLVKYRDFDSHNSAIVKIIPEVSRKAFIAYDQDGMYGIYHTTAERTVFRGNLYQGEKVKHAVLSPAANMLVVESEEGTTRFWSIHNEHPEISLSSLFGKVWYEGRSEPEYVYQSSAIGNDNEPKLSLMPLAFGTIKAAFYAMLIAVPLALFGAVYTSQFMTTRLRKVVKPSIEIMEALPTVILGFLAGVWLAPYVRDHLIGILLLLVALPIGIVFAAFSWSKLPEKIRHLIPEGWEAVLLIPVIFIIAWVSLGISQHLEHEWFNDDLAHYGKYFGPWLSNNIHFVVGLFLFPFIYWLCVRKPYLENKIKIASERYRTMVIVIIAAILSYVAALLLSPLFVDGLFDGNIIQYYADATLEYDERNALIIGLAMGFAVIPTIFSIAEDALFAVPKHLIQGSLALGATQWQTLTRVVILTASPGIFSAIMIGFGRAIGETMIVVMATGNKAVMDFSLFEGMRTFSANIAIEMPEAEVASTHYRILFLAALILFLFTFAFNTIAEMVRQRLRKKYSSL